MKLPKLTVGARLRLGFGAQVADPPGTDAADGQVVVLGQAGAE